MHPSILIVLLLSCMLQSIYTHAAQPSDPQPRSLQDSQYTGSIQFTGEVPEEQIRLFDVELEGVRQVEEQGTISEGEKLIKSIQESLPSVQGWSRLWYSVYIRLLSVNYKEKCKHLFNCSDDEDVDGWEE